MRRALLPLLLALIASACAGLSGEPEIVATIAPASMPGETTSPANAWQPNIENGAAIFAERCTQCHGISGDGQGDLVLSGSVARPLDMTDRAAVAEKSPLEWFEIISEGRIEKLMPPWKDALSEGERWDVALYSYTLAYDESLLKLGARIWNESCAGCALPGAIPPVFSDAEYGARLNRELFAGNLTLEESAAALAFARMQSLAGAGDAEPEAPQGSVMGRVAHGSSGGIVPADTVVQLQYGSAEAGFKLVETALQEDLRFAFSDVPLASHLNYAIAVIYQGRLFSRQFAAEEAGDLTLTLYDVTHEASLVSVSRIDLFVEAVKLADLGSGLFIRQLINFHNKSDRIFTSGRQFDDGREAVLLLQFPSGARSLTSDQGGRYVLIEDIDDLPDSVIDTSPVPPGEAHQAVLEYFLPLEGSADFAQEFNNLVDADVQLSLAPGLRAESDSIALEEQEGARDEPRVYTGRLSMENDPRLSFVISGDPFPRGDAIVSQDQLTILLLGAAGVGLAMAGGFALRRRRKPTAAGEIDQLTRELARLDDDHDQGRLNHDLWHQKRRELKARLAELMGADE